MYSHNTAVFYNTVVFITKGCLAVSKKCNFNTAVFGKPHYFLCIKKRTTYLFFFKLSLLRKESPSLIPSSQHASCPRPFYQDLLLGDLVSSLPFVAPNYSQPQNRFEDVVAIRIASQNMGLLRRVHGRSWCMAEQLHKMVS